MVKRAYIDLLLTLTKLHKENENFNVIQNIERYINYLLREFEVSFAGGHVPVIGETAPKTDHAAMNSQQFKPGQPSCGICL